MDNKEILKIAFGIQKDSTLNLILENSGIEDQVKAAMTAAREEGRREGAIGFVQFTAVLGLDYFVEHKSGVAILHNGSNRYTLDQAYDLYIQSLQNKSK